MQRVAFAKQCFAEPGPRFPERSQQPGPRLCSAPLRKGYALRCVRGTCFNYFIRLNRTRLPSASRVAT
jgi:hypothetical protein